MREVTETHNKRDYWIRENLQYAEPNFRLRKCARLVNELTAGKACDLLDVGCGPAALRSLLPPNINYHGIDLSHSVPGAVFARDRFCRRPNRL